MLTHWKYALEVKPVQTITLPHKAEPLCVNLQSNQIVMHWLVETFPDGKKVGDDVEVTVLMYETGAPADSCRNQLYVGTVFLNDGRYVLHVYLKKDDD